MMRLSLRLFSFVLIVTFVTGCASTRVPAEESAVGSWSYTVYDTPQGNVDGVVTFMLDQGKLTGQMSSEAVPGTVSLNNVALEDQRLSFSASFNMDGYPLQTETVVSLNEDKMEGNIEISGVGTYRIQGSKKG